MVAGPKVLLPATDAVAQVNMLFHLAESRGSEAAGLAIAAGDSLRVFKRAQPARRMIASDDYRRLVREAITDEAISGGLALIGHSRLVTNGSQGLEENNQPVATRHIVGVHNGIVVNEASLWRAYPELEHTTAVDSEVIFRLVEKFQADQAPIEKAISEAYAAIQGEANVAFFDDSERSLALATNVGSLYFAQPAANGVFYFASERYFLESLFRRAKAMPRSPVPSIEQLAPGQGLIVPIDGLAPRLFNFASVAHSGVSLRRGERRPIVDVSPKRPTLRRCTCCVLPHTFPFISFDSEGVCNFCREGPPRKVDNLETLEARVAKYRRNDGKADCIVALSGGRDSCYGLHFVKRELGLHPIAYTYDWAMVTDEARRNCSRVCAELGVEHVVRSADILGKRRNIRLNIEAWLRRPELGMIPLFMAGDKQFFHYATQVSRQTRIPLVIFCGGNNLEVTRFKTGFCGVQDRSTNSMVGLDLTGKLKLLAYYAKNYLMNPRYINRSVFDTLFAFYSTYVNRQDFVYLYRYVEWNERTIHDVLARHYGWESSDDSASTWRIGDGTAAFYNYIYHTVAGFSEHDTFRSNQIRAGLISREEALAAIAEENRPRYAAMREYAQLVGFSLDEALVVINNIPKLA